MLTYDKSKFKKTGELIGATVVEDDDEVMLINSDGIIIRISAGEVSKLGRATQGVKIMRVKKDANIISMTKVIKEDNTQEDDSSDKSEEDNEQQRAAWGDMEAGGEDVSYLFRAPDGDGSPREGDRALAVHIDAPDDGFWVMINMSPDPVDFRVPAAGGGDVWRRLVDTAVGSEKDDNCWRGSQEDDADGTRGPTRFKPAGNYWPNAGPTT